MENLRGFSQHAALALQHALDRFPQVLDEMKAVRHLQSTGCSRRHAVGIISRSIARDHLHTGVLLEPSGEGPCFPIGEQLNGSPPFQIHQNGAITLATM
jgi:hypothetical protein